MCGRGTNKKELGCGLLLFSPLLHDVSKQRRRKISLLEVGMGSIIDFKRIDPRLNNLLMLVEKQHYVHSYVKWLLFTRRWEFPCVETKHGTWNHIKFTGEFKIFINFLNWFNFFHMWIKLKLACENVNFLRWKLKKKLNCNKWEEK